MNKKVKNDRIFFVEVKLEKVELQLQCNVEKSSRCPPLVNMYMFLCMSLCYTCGFQICDSDCVVQRPFVQVLIFSKNAHEINCPLWMDFHPYLEKNSGKILLRSECIFSLIGLFYWNRFFGFKTFLPALIYCSLKNEDDDLLIIGHKINEKLMLKRLEMGCF